MIWIDIRRCATICVVHCSSIQDPHCCLEQKSNRSLLTTTFSLCRLKVTTLQSPSKYWHCSTETTRMEHTAKLPAQQEVSLGTKMLIYGVMFIWIIKWVCRIICWLCCVMFVVFAMLLFACTFAASVFTPGYTDELNWVDWRISVLMLLFASLVLWTLVFIPLGEFLLRRSPPKG